MELFFEYQKRNYLDIPFLKTIEGRLEFKAVLNCLWAKRKQFGLTSVYFTEDNTEQQFFTFYDNYIKANNYIGTIKFGENTVQILPKIFQQNNVKLDENELLIIVNSNILWWLSRATKIKFPRSFTGWDSQSYNFIDIFIHLFSSLTRDDLIFNKHQSYIIREEPIQTLRGRVDFSKYAVNYYTGNAHVLPCIYDSLEIDNLYNQIVKFTAKLLLYNTENQEIKKLLEEIIWVLDDVSDQFINFDDCDKVVVSPLNQNMKIILDYCRMFLSGMSVKMNDDKLEIFTLLIPTESLFQDFVFGFINDEFEHDKNIKGIYNETNNEGKRVPLAKEVSDSGKVKHVFGLKPDIYIEREIDDIILDTKYKVIYTKEEAKEETRQQTGISISDVYQMLAYTVKFNVKTVHLLYPAKFNSIEKIGSYYEIDHHINGSTSTIYYHRIPVILESKNKETSLEQRIEIQENKLHIVLKPIVCS